MEEAVLAGGCFWCTEAIYKNLNGVVAVEPGYTGGNFENPTYEIVSSGRSGHAEAIKIVFDNRLISYHQVLEVFFATHNPTTLNKQGHDIGSQYRSAIFYIDENQKNTAKQYIEDLEKNKVFDSKIVTELSPLSKFYKAEEYHKDYYNKNKDAPYCKLVISPKLESFAAKYKSFLKT